MWPSRILKVVAETPGGVPPERKETNRSAEFSGGETKKGGLPFGI
jgi:hypothetical protein